MNKYIKILGLLVFFTCLECKGQDTNQDNILSIKYEAKTRGSSFLLTITNDKLNFSSIDRKNNKVLTKTQKSKLIQLVNEIDLSQMNLLEAPSEKRYTDGAMFATLSITKDNKTYKTSEFDHGNPPKVLSSLYVYLISLNEKLANKNV
jgi:hypothetical protein